jgi:formate dehydrogenase maturation protein FdhE
MQPLTQFGLLAEKHWREFLPRMVAELETKGELHAMLLTAQQQTEAELGRLCRQLVRQGLSAQQAHHTAWEIVRERYIFLPPET